MDDEDSSVDDVWETPHKLRPVSVTSEVVERWHAAANKSAEDAISVWQELLTSQQAKGFDVNSRFGPEQSTVLHRAVKDFDSDGEKVKWLLRHKADVRMVD